MYDPEQVDALIAERDRLRRELDHVQTLLAEAEAVIGEPLVEAMAAAVGRLDAGRPYALRDLATAVENAFYRMASDRNEWRARARRASR